MYCLTGPAHFLRSYRVLQGNIKLNCNSTAIALTAYLLRVMRKVCLDPSEECGPSLILMGNFVIGQLTGYEHHVATVVEMQLDTNGIVKVLYELQPTMPPKRRVFAAFIKLRVEKLKVPKLPRN